MATLNHPERMRTAAARLEALDRAAPGGPWVMRLDSTLDQHSIRSLADPVPGMYWPVADDVQEESGRLIAALRPLAPWAVTYLRATADLWADQVQDYGRRAWHIDGCEQTVLKDGRWPEPPHYRCTCFDQALALADTILGPAAPDPDPAAQRRDAARGLIT